MINRLTKQNEKVKVTYPSKMSVPVNVFSFPNKQQQQIYIIINVNITTQIVVKNRHTM